MTRPNPPTYANLPGMLTELAISSWDTIFRRSALMLQGQCSIAEYQRMIWEKAEAAQASMTVLAVPGPLNVAAALNPWLQRAKANSKRLKRDT
jgi:hypothetical protein